MKIQKYSEFILEKVYLYKTVFNSYKLIVDPYSKVGKFELDIKDHGLATMEAQIYGDKEDKQLIFRIPHEITHLDNKMDLFKDIVEDVIYILNKNRLGYEFTLNTITQDRPPLNEYALINVNKEMTIEDFERLAQTTKIINAKVKDINDFDKLVYYTNENKMTTIDFNVKEYRGFDIEKSHDYYRVYQKDGRKLLWEDISLKGCEKWIDELHEWMHSNESIRFH